MASELIDYAKQHHSDIRNLNYVAENLLDSIPELHDFAMFDPYVERLSTNPIFMNALGRGIEAADVMGQSTHLSSNDEKWFLIETAIETTRRLIGDCIDEEVTGASPHQGRIAQGRGGMTENDRYHKGLGTSSSVLFSLVNYYHENLRDICPIGQFMVEVSPIVVNGMKISLSQLDELRDALVMLKLDRVIDPSTNGMRFVPRPGSALADLYGNIPTERVSIRDTADDSGKDYTRRCLAPLGWVASREVTEDQGDRDYKDVSFICPSYYTREKLHLKQLSLVAASYEILTNDKYQRRLRQVENIGHIYHALDSLISGSRDGIVRERVIAEELIENLVVFEPMNGRSRDFVRDVGGVISDFVVVGKGFLSEITSQAIDGDNFTDLWLGCAKRKDFYIWIADQMINQGNYAPQIAKLLKIRSRYGMDLKGWRDALEGK